jgi:hypothetical protein
LISVAWWASAGGSSSVISSISRTFVAEAIDSVGSRSAIAGIVYIVVHLITEAWNSADLESDIEVSVGWAGLACTSDQVVSLIANTDLVNKELVWTAWAGWNWEGLGEGWSVGCWNTVATVQSIALDAVTCSCLSIVG